MSRFTPRQKGDALNRNIEKALDVTNNVIIVGDINVDLLSPNVHNLKDNYTDLELSK